MKITKAQQKQSEEIYRRLIARAWEDDSFKKDLVNKPVITIENFKEEKLVLPKNTQIVVDDQTDISKIYLNIPRRIDLTDFELADEELEMVSGGIFFVTAGYVTLAVGLILLGGELHDLVHGNK